MTSIISYPFDFFSELRLDVEAIIRTWDDGGLSDADKRRLRFAVDLIYRGRPSRGELVLAVAIIRTTGDRRSND
jgi:hypothetical protein